MYRRRWVGLDESCKITSGIYIVIAPKKKRKEKETRPCLVSSPLMPDIVTTNVSTTETTNMLKKREFKTTRRLTKIR